MCPDKFELLFVWFELSIDLFIQFTDLAGERLDMLGMHLQQESVMVCDPAINHLDEKSDLSPEWFASRIKCPTFI
ncbi:MAG: hypothetical protein C5S48_04925 [Candidatus Methanogaster sp.]|nr:MAG: hypothetical protein C5S48_04925 [ANME-2 cluster archaeon]